MALSANARQSATAAPIGRSGVEVLVLGAGVIGLTTAITLAESGLRVGVRTASPPGATASVAAGAVWGPVTCGPAERVRGWARTGLAVFRELEADPATGIVTRAPAGNVPASRPTPALARPDRWPGALPRQ